MNHMLPRPRFWAETAEQIRTRRSMLGELLIYMLIYVICVFAQSILIAIPMTAWMLSSQGASMMSSLMNGASPQELVLELIGEMPDWLAPVSLFAAAVLGAAAILYTRRFQKRDLASMGLRRGGAAGEFLLGFVLGLVLFGAAVAVGSAAGGYRVLSGIPADVPWLVCFAALLGCLVQGAAWELLVRGSFAPALGARYPLIFALLLSSLFPAMLQSGGTMLSMLGLNNLLLSLLLGIWVIKRGRLWGACALHGAWSFAGSFLFGFAPAGEHGGVRLLDVDLDLYRPLLSGGEEGPQASICVTIVLLAGIGAVLALRPRDPAPEPLPAPDEQAANFL